MQMIISRLHNFSKNAKWTFIATAHVSGPTVERYSRYGPVRIKVYGEETGLRTNAVNDLSQSESKESRFAWSLIGLESFAQVDLVSLEACVSM